MNNNFPINRFDFSDLISYIQKTEVLPNILIDDATGIEFYGANTVSREYLICCLTDFNMMDNLAQMDSEHEYINTDFSLKFARNNEQWIMVTD